jgi:pyridoxal phosphate enzyme (YggS family)
VTDIRANLADVRRRIEAAAAAAGRSPAEVGLVAISKTFPVEALAEAVAAGQLRLGENKVQEAEPKVRGLASGPRIEWHLVGHLQSNKGRRAAEIFDVIHSVDSLRLAVKLDAAARELRRTLSILVQVDLRGEPTKSGVERDGLEALVDGLAALDGLSLDGLMTLPPFAEDPERARPYFRELRELRDRLEARRPGCLGRRHLSMGMSHDFEVAIAEGATLVRIGTAIFGARRP